MVFFQGTSILGAKQRTGDYDLIKRLLEWAIPLDRNTKVASVLRSPCVSPGHPARSDFSQSSSTAKLHPCCPQSSRPASMPGHGRNAAAKRASGPHACGRLGHLCSIGFLPAILSCSCFFSLPPKPFQSIETTIII